VPSWHKVASSKGKRYCARESPSTPQLSGEKKRESTGDVARQLQAQISSLCDTLGHMQREKLELYQSMAPSEQVARSLQEEISETRAQLAKLRPLVAAAPRTRTPGRRASLADEESENHAIGADPQAAQAADPQRCDDAEDNLMPPAPPSGVLVPDDADDERTVLAPGIGDGDFVEGAAYDMSGDEDEAEDDHRFSIADESPRGPETSAIAWTPKGMSRGGGLFHFL